MVVNLGAKLHKLFGVASICDTFSTSNVWFFIENVYFRRHEKSFCLNCDVFCTWRIAFECFVVR